MAMDIGQAEVAAGVAEGEFLVVEAEQPEDRGVKIMHMDFFLDRLETEFIGRTVNIPAADTTTRQPHGEPVMVVIAAVALAGIRAGCGQLDGWRAAKFPAPNQDCIV